MPSKPLASSSIHSRDSYNPFSTSGGTTSSTRLLTEESSEPASASYLNQTGKHPTSRKQYRIPKVYYPLQINRRIRDTEIWENALIQLTTGHPMISALERVPSRPLILELACGYGVWSILAAQYFEAVYSNFLQESQVTGFDLQNIQPSLKDLGYDDVAKRLTWVHGDMLEGLPFPDESFDIVKSQYIELCIPEFKEIDRVLKPGGFLELTLQTPIFPCPRFPPRLKFSSKRSCETFKPGISSQLQDHDPRDHSLLKEAFDAMLDARHLNPQLLKLLPDTFNSVFEDVLMSPICHAMLPPSSLVRELPDNVVGDMTVSTCMEDKPFDISVLFLPTNEELEIEYGGRLPLNATINLVLACKDAIWEQFEAINQSLKRNDFEYLMDNWEYDMRDRMNMSDAIKEHLQWKCNTDAEPERKSWRTELLKYHEADGIWDALPIPQPCRSMRIFIASKRSKPSESVS
ncbi:hypothetical protein Clacol_002802 [Clathrus columnatus]|uniref:Methyltransferase domain-containing protein n=1 Tax=Clathrus columnatus TaxID=1419009 RepID=A0AAV5A535_9AGAM|nr:hypothetical protein Clacol_002802 [Clathrus columnatus]